MTLVDQRDRASGDQGPQPKRRRRRWPWVLGVLLLLLGTAVLVVWLTTNRARPVTMRQAQSRLPKGGGAASSAIRPVPGVYAYSGSGTEHLSSPPLSQAEGPTMPGTVTLQGSDCWIFRIDYSTHHWQTWRYCLHDGDLWEMGGQSWQLWSIGPINATNLSTFTCAPGTMSLPAKPVPGQKWEGKCTGTNSSVKGKTVSAGPYQFIGRTTLSIAGTPVAAEHFLRLRTDSGAQTGSERSEVWLDARTGLPLRLQQDIKVTSATPFGTSTYSQVGIFTVTSMMAHEALP
ncbi:MAG TPA: hypothetical protein VEI83_11825 [Acidimicrobiales bacterium]|nr:hypothetical protein [Acidimicrobiales bacterium]